MQTDRPSFRFSRLKYLLPIVFAGVAIAQDSAALKLTLRDAVSLALKQNPQVILANLEVARSEQERLIARSGLLPQAAGSANLASHRINVEAALGIRFPGMSQHAGPFSTAQGGVSFQAPVFDLSLWRRYRESQLGIDASQAQEVSAREESVLLVVSQYLGAQRAAAEVQAAKSRLDLAETLYKQAVDVQASGVGTGIDTLRANVQRQNERQRTIVAQTQLDTSLFALARLLNIDPARRVELADAVTFFETPAIQVEQSLQQAYAARPELRELSARRRQLELERRSAGEQRLPKLSVGGYWAQMGLTSSTLIPSYQYQASLDFPLFTGGRIQAQRAEADIRLRQLTQQETDIRNRVALEVKTAAARLESARSEVDVARLGVDLARQEVEQAGDRFRAGVANNVEVVTAQDELARANDNEIAALYRFNQARADLAHSTGQMEALYGK
jgi:outer membrane protein